MDAGRSRPPAHLRVLIVAASIRIMGGQAVMAQRLIADMRQDGMQVELLPITPRPPGFLSYTERVKYLRTLVVSFFYIISLVRSIPRCDVVHVFSASYLSFLISPAPAILIARLFGKTVILNYHSGEAADHLRRSGRLVFFLLRLPHKLVVPSRYLVDVFNDFGIRAMCITNHIETNEFRFRERTSIQPRIIVPRALEPLYNVACAIRAFRIVKTRFCEAEMTILGEGSQRRKLERLVSELGLDGVTFAGRVEREEIGSVYDQHDVFLNTSSIDNMPVSVLEAFASGLPVVTTDAGGIPNLVQDRVNGHLVAVDDHQAIAERLIELIEDHTEVARLSRLGKKEAAKYGWATVGPQWYDLYRKTVEARTNGKSTRALSPRDVRETKLS